MARAVRVDLVADPTKFVRGMRQAQGSSQRFTQHTSRAGDALKGAFAAFSAGAVIVGLKKAVDAASAMNETTSKTKVVFGGSSKAVTDFAKNAATSMGLSRQEAMEAAATFGNLFVSMKIGAPQAAEMSTEMVKLAGDLASFNNASPADTLEALRSGLVGETEPLRKFGINLNDADLRQKALSMGLTKTTKDVLPPAIKAQAAYALILDQSKTAQGDFARTSDGLANKQRILSAQWKDAQATIGSLLLPAMLTLVSAMSGFIGVVDDNRTAFGVLFGVLAGGAAIIGTLIAASKIHAAVTEAITVATAAWGTVQKAMNVILGTTTAQTGAATVATEGLTVATGTSGAAATGAAASFRALAASVGLLTAGIGLGVFSVKTWIDTVKKGTSENEKFGGTVQLGTKFGGLYAQSMNTSAAATNNHATATTNATAATKASKEEQQQAQAAAAALNATITAQTEKLKPLKEQFAQQSKAIEDTITSYEGLITQSDVTTTRVIQDIHNQVANFKTYSRDVRRLIKAGVDPAAIEELSQKGPQYIHALAEGSNAQLKKYKGYWQSRQSEVKGGFATSMGQMYEDLRDKIRKMQREINRLKDKTVFVGATAAVTLQEKTRRALLEMGIKGYGVRFLAEGGMTRLGQTAIVGEEGPELVQFSRPAQVYSAKETRDILRRGMADGGIVGGFGGPSVEFARRLGTAAGERLAAVAGQKLSGVVANWATGSLGGLAGPGGWQWQMRVLRDQFPGMQLISGFRPGAITATGNRSYHGFGRAVDIPPNMGYFNWIASNYGKRTKELIFSPAGSRQIHNGQHHLYSGITRQNHWDHVHWAYDKGGFLPPGTSLATNTTGKAEAVGFDYERMADAFVAALEQRPPAVYLDRQKVSRAVRNGDLWEARR